MKGYKSISLSKRPSMVIRDKRKTKTWNKKLPLPIGRKEIISQKEAQNDKNHTYN